MRLGGKGIPDETYLPSFQGPPRPYARLSGPHEDARRACRDQRPQGQGPQASGRLNSGTTPPIAPMLGRLSRSADFERALRHPPSARSAHFAVHCVVDGMSAVEFGVSSTDLSTAGEQACTPLVDDLTTPWLRSGSAIRLGAVLPKRHARRSVTRSLLKREIRAAAARQVSGTAPCLAEGIWVVRLRAPFDRAQFVSAASSALRSAARCELETLFASVPRRPLVAASPCR
jgi:ribonuclease P protein component